MKKLIAITLISVTVVGCTVQVHSRKVPLSGDPSLKISGNVWYDKHDKKYHGWEKDRFFDDTLFVNFDAGNYMCYLNAKGDTTWIIKPEIK